MPTAASDSSFGLRVPLPRPRAAEVQVQDAQAGMLRVRIWDLPTRVFHWSLACALVGMTVTGYGGGAWMEWHGRIGSFVLALLLFRVVWGCVGGRWSRFATFLPTPARLKRYLQGPETPDQQVGHSPIAALSVLAMLLVLFAQVFTGLASDDGGGYTGPLNEYLSSAAGLAATALHKNVGQWLLLALVLLHIAAIAFYRVVRRRKLVQAMLDGDQRVQFCVPPSRDDARSRALAAVVFGVCLMGVGSVIGF